MTVAEAITSMPHIRFGFLLLRHEGLERLVDSRIERRGLIASEHGAPFLVGALDRVLLAGIAPLLEGGVVGGARIPEGGLVIPQRMGAAEEMLAGTDLAEGIEGECVLVQRDPGEIGVERAAEIGVENELF